MRWNGAHLFTCPEVNREVRDILLEDVAQPIVPLFDLRIAETRFDADWETACFCSLDQFSCDFRTIDQTGAFSVHGDVMDGTAHVDVDPAKAHLCHADAHFAKIFRFVAPDVSDHWLFILRELETSADALFAFRMTIAFCIRKFREEDVRTRRFCDDVAEDDVGDVFHRC